VWAVKKANPMTKRTVEWIVFTCLIGLIPVVARLAIWVITTQGVKPLSVGDVVSFGLVVHSVALSQLQELDNSGAKWRASQSGLSILFLVMYALLLFTTINPTVNIDLTNVLIATLALALASLLIGFSVVQRVSLQKEISHDVW